MKGWYKGNYKLLYKHNKIRLEAYDQIVENFDEYDFERAKKFSDCDELLSPEVKTYKNFKDDQKKRIFQLDAYETEGLECALRMVNNFGFGMVDKEYMTNFYGSGFMIDTDNKIVFFHDR